MPVASKDVPAPARTAGLVVPVVIALLVFLAIAIVGSVMALRGSTNTGHGTDLQQAARSDVNAQKNSFSGR